jgi:predicted phage terminase large subunit-like protein
VVHALHSDAVGRYQSWDTAEDEGENNAYSSCATGELAPDYKLRVTEVWRDKMGFTDLCHKIVQKATEANIDGKLRKVVIEKKSTGVAAINHLKTAGPEWLRPLIFANTPHTSKVQRANAAAPWCENGMVLLPEPSGAVPWLLTFETELLTFPGSAEKDQVDSFTQLVWYLNNFLAEGLRFSAAPFVDQRKG